MSVKSHVTVSVRIGAIQRHTHRISTLAHQLWNEAISTKKGPLFTTESFQWINILINTSSVYLWTRPCLKDWQLAGASSPAVGQYIQGLLNHYPVNKLFGNSWTKNVASDKLPQLHPLIIRNAVKHSSEHVSYRYNSNVYKIESSWRLMDLR